MVVFHGDAATANGQWHEGVNIAAVQHLPLLLVCEDNHLAGNITSGYYNPVVDLKQRAAGYGIQHAYVNGNVIEAVQRAAEKAVDYVRQESKPFFLVCGTTRLGKHKQGMGDMRGESEMRVLNWQDPLNPNNVTFDPSLVEAYTTEIDALIASILEGPDPTLE